MPDILFQWPLWVVLALMIVFFVGTSELMLILVRRRLPQGLTLRGGHESFAAALIHSMVVFYGLVAALIAVGVYETYSEVSRTVSREAAAISALYRDVGTYPEPTRSEVQQAIRDYTQQIIHEAWPQQRHGHTPTGGVVLVTRIQERLSAFEPVTEGQKLVHGESLRALNEMLLARRLRVDANREHLPDVMWRILIFGALLCLFAACLFYVENAMLHAMSVGLLAMLIAVVMFMTFAWDRPYVGEFGVDAGTYELVYEQLMKPH